MKFSKHSKIIQIEISEDSSFEEMFSKFFYDEFKNVFSNIYQNSELIEFKNNFFSLLVVWNFLEIITSGRVELKKNKRMILLSYELNFSSYLCFWFFVILIFIGALISQDLLVAIIVPLVWLMLSFMFIQIAIIRFNNRIYNCIKISNGIII